MKTNILKFTAILLIAAGFFSACENKEPVSKISGLTFTPCKQTQQTQAKRNAPSDGVSVEFTTQGVHITYNHFEVTCDFSTVDVTYTFVNGFLNITQQGLPNRADCVCYSDVSYTINGISQNEVNVIFINGEQVYCHNDNEPDDPNPNDTIIENWVWSQCGYTVKLKLCPTDSTFYSSVQGESECNGFLRQFIIFPDDYFCYYKIVGDTMYIRAENQDFHAGNGNWLIYQYTEEVLKMRRIGNYPDIYVTYYWFNRQY